MQQTVPTKHRGFTLIELLLVLALVVALTVAGIAAYQIQLRNFKVDKTALQIQQWLQAGMAFNADCTQWPTDSVTDPAILRAMTGQVALTNAQCSPFTGQTRTYMPANSIDNGPWSNSYQIGPFPVGISPKVASLFYVSTDIGADDKDKVMQNVGKMIAGRLPNAEVVLTGGRVVVRAQVNAVPSGPNSPGGIKILDMEMVDSRYGAQHIRKPVDGECPAGTRAALLSAISSVDGGLAIDSSGGRPRTFLNTAGLSNGIRIDDDGYIDWNTMPLNPKNQNMIESNFAQTTDARFQSDTTYNSRNAKNKMLFISVCMPSKTLPLVPVIPVKSNVRY